jgi:hypothetical protein
VDNIRAILPIKSDDNPGISPIQIPKKLGLELDSHGIPIIIILGLLAYWDYDGIIISCFI